MSIQSSALKMTVLLALATAPLAALPPATAARKDTAKPHMAGVASTIILTISTPPTISYGEDVGGYALVTSSDGTTLTGTVTFFDGASNICTIPVTQTTSCPASAGTNFVAGTHMLTAVYSGDATHQSSTSNGVPVIVLPDVTTISVTSSTNPAIYGQGVTFTATAQGDHAVPSGQIEFLDGSSVIAAATLNPAGVATASTSSLTIGMHSITAHYAATQNFGAATSAALSEVIQSPAPIATVTTLASNINPATNGQTVTFTANVTTPGSSLVSAGTVTFLDGSSTLGTAALNSSGVAVLNTASLSAGTHAISARYEGDTGASSSSSTPLEETINTSSSSQSSAFALTVTGTPTVMIGRAVDLLVTIAPKTGTISPVQLSCTNLPPESACTFGMATLPANGGTTSLQISTMAPHSCESDNANSQSAAMPFAGPALAGLFLLFFPRRRSKSAKGLILMLVAVCGMASLTGCGGNCTDLGTRPGDYTIHLVGTSNGTPTVTTKIVLHVTVPEGN